MIGCGTPEVSCRRTRVLNITPSGDLGGRERQLLSISEALRENPSIQFDVLFMNARGPFYEASVEAGVVTLTAPTGLFQTLRYVELMRTYDIINFWGVNWRVFLAGILSGRTLTFSLQGARGVMQKRIKDLVVPAASRSDTRISFVEKTGYSIWKSRLRRFLRKWLLIHFLRRCSTVIVPSQYLADFCVSYYGLRRNQIAVINNAVNFNSIITTKTEKAIREELGLSPDTFLVGVAARYDTRKRLDRLIEAMGNLKKYPTIQAVIYGGGDPQIKANLDRQIEEYGIEGKVLFPGFRNDIYNYINALDVFVLPSDSEGMGLSIVESVFLRRPTVVFQDGGGVLEVIKDKQTGYVVKTVAELSELIVSLYKKQEISQTICEQGHDFVLNQFDVTLTAKEYARLLIGMNE